MVDIKIVIYCIESIIKIVNRGLGVRCEIRRNESLFSFNLRIICRLILKSLDSGFKICRISVNCILILCGETFGNCKLSGNYFGCCLVCVNIVFKVRRDLCNSIVYCGVICNVEFKISVSCVDGCCIAVNS